MRINVETDENGYAIGKCHVFGDVIAGGHVCNYLCRFRGETDFHNRTFECKWKVPSLPESTRKSEWIYDWSYQKKPNSETNIETKFK